MGRVPWQEWKEIFLLNQKALGLSKRTLDDYIYHIDYFLSKAMLNQLMI